MKALLLCWVSSCLAWLLPAASHACAVCRPKVQATIHNADYSANAALLLLPVALLLALGLGLYYAEALLALVRRPRLAPSLTGPTL